MAGAGSRACPLMRFTAVAILTDLEWPVLAESHTAGAVIDWTLRSSPTWNGRCWSRGTTRSRPTTSRCDPHRLGMAGAGAEHVQLVSDAVAVAILTDLEWPVLAMRRPRVTSSRPGLRSSPTWNGRCWPVEVLGLAARPGVAILTALEWPVPAQRRQGGVMPAKVLRSSPTWNGRCWMIAMPSKTSPPGVAILTDLEWPVLAESLSTGAPAAVTLRSSPTWNGRCWEPAP